MKLGRKRRELAVSKKFRPLELLGLEQNRFTPTPLIEGDLVVEMQVSHDWVSGYMAEVTISNLGSDPLEEWTLEFDLNGRIVDIWDGEIVRSSGSRYEIRNMDYNSEILPRRTISFGFQIETTRIGQMRMTDVLLNGRAV
jgi:cellulase/cellobiase CelA1